MHLFCFHPHCAKTFFSISDNVHEGMGQSILYYLQQNYSKKGSKKPTMDFVVICQSDWIVNTSKWLNLVEAQSSPHDLVIGDVRDKAQLPREFPVSADPFFHQFHDLHLYLGSSCLALSTTLVPKILEQASSNQEARDKYFENNLGHDLACLASMSPKPTVLHWIPITQTQQFWNNLE